MDPEFARGLTDEQFEEIVSGRLALFAQDMDGVEELNKRKRRDSDKYSTTPTATPVPSDGEDG